MTRKITRAVAASSSACKTRCTSATSMRSATGAMPGTMSRACGGSCSRTSPTITCWRPARSIRCANSSSSPSPKSAATSNGAARGTRSRHRPAIGRTSFDRSRLLPADRGGPAARRPRKARQGSAGAQDAVRSTRQGNGGERSGDRAARRRQWQAPRLSSRARRFSSPAIAAWSAPRWCAGSPAKTSNSLTAGRREVDLRDQAAVRLVRRQAPAGGVPRRGQGRRHRRQQHAARRFHLRQSRHRAQCHSRRASQRRREAAVSRLVLHLSEAGAAADARGAMLTGPLEPTNEPYAIAKIAGIKMVEAYRSQYGVRFHQRDADQSLRPRRQLSSRAQPRRRCVDPPLS